ncbi:unnamed protein product [Mytilus coruscus]|uniref:Uncharacterized protein n=1 Tax=Mytilus coruscus TaxID=42192 RepID=A0A6J8A5T6_MYTCO|nr:unnamed protein product [Mytilus coruscus]
MELPNELKALLVTMKLGGKEPEWKFTASSDQVSVQLNWIKPKEPDTSSRNPKPALQKKNKPPSTRRRNTKRVAQWMDTQTAVVPAAAQEQNTKRPVLTTTVRRKPGTQYPYNTKKACHCLIYYTLATERDKRSRIDFDEGFDTDDPDLLTTPPHTSPLNLTSKDAIEAAILSERSNIPYQQQHLSWSKMKAKRQADPALQQ